MSKGLVNLTFSYPSILTVSIYDGCLGIVAAMACDTYASCVGTMFLGGIFCWHNALLLETQGTSPLWMQACANQSGAAKAWKGRVPSS